jgi:UMF1 family MFS transporter
LFRNIAEPGGREGARVSVRMVIDGWSRLKRTLKQIRRYRQLALFLTAFWLYNDGVSTIIKMAAAYGDEIGIGHNDMLLALILTQFIGFPSTLGFGALARYFGAKRSILLGLACYMVISICGFFIKSACTLSPGSRGRLVQGGTQALSRSLFTMMVPKAQSAEFLVSSAPARKLAGIIGPAPFGLAANSRAAAGGESSR